MGKYEILKNEMSRRGLSSNKLALGAMISPANFSQVINGKLPMYPAWKHRISEYLGMPESELFPDAQGTQKEV